MQHAHDLRARRCYGDVPDHPHRHPRRAGSRAEVSQVSRAGRLLRRCLCVPHYVFIRQPSDGVPRVLVSLHTTWMLRFVGVKIQQRNSNRHRCVDCVDSPYKVLLCCTPVFRTRRQRLNPTTILQLKLLSFVASRLRAAAFVSCLWVRLFVCLVCGCVCSSSGAMLRSRLQWDVSRVTAMHFLGYYTSQVGCFRALASKHCSCCELNKPR